MLKNIVLFFALVLSGISGSVRGVQNFPVPSENAQPNPLAISEMRKKEYPGSGITIEKTLSSGGSFSRYLTSYRSDGLKIFALLTVPRGAKPTGGLPVILFNHGYIPPSQYQTAHSRSMHRMDMSMMT